MKTEYFYVEGWFIEVVMYCKVFVKTARGFYGDKNLQKEYVVDLLKITATS